jgi:hypothetical protein
MEQHYGQRRYASQRVQFSESPVIFHVIARLRSINRKLKRSTMQRNRSGDFIVRDFSDEVAASIFL